MATLTLSDVYKAYSDSNYVIKGVDLDVQDGELIVLLGPSGCGKSTLLRMVAGLESISTGDIHIADKNVNKLEPKARNIAMVFQNYALYPHMSVYDNMAYGLKISGVPREEIRTRVEEAATMLELSPYLDRKPRALSGGQRQRVAMGRAIVRKPAVFLFDEPLSNLDAKLRTHMRVQIRHLQKKLRVTSLYVTHDQVEAMTLADRIVVLNKGVAEQIGTPIEVYNKPASLFVAGFIGSPGMNFLTAEISGDGGHLLLKDGHKLDLNGVKLPASAVDRPLIVGIRPENLFLAKHNESPHRFPLHLSAVEQLGADTILYGELDSGELALRVPGQQIMGEDAEILVGYEPEDLHIFDAETGKRLSD